MVRHVNSYSVGLIVEGNTYLLGEGIILNVALTKVRVQSTAVQQYKFPCTKDLTTKYCCSLKKTVEQKLGVVVQRGQWLPNTTWHTKYTSGGEVYPEVLGCSVGPPTHRKCTISLYCYLGVLSTVTYHAHEFFQNGKNDPDDEMSVNCFNFHSQVLIKDVVCYTDMACLCVELFLFIDLTVGGSWC